MFRLIITTAAGALLFPPIVLAQEKEDKDAIIKMLKEQLAEKDAVNKMLTDQLSEQQKAILLIQAQNKERFAIGKKLADALNEMKQEHESLLAKLKLTQADLALREAVAALKLKEFELQGIRIETALKQSLITQKRLHEEIAVLAKTIAEREALIVKLEADIKVVRIQAQNFENLGRARQIQNENLLELVRAQTKKIALLEAGLPVAQQPKDPNARNPPAVFVNGMVQKIDDKDASLVIISLGKDHGVEKGHTLDVYRLKPEPKYLGMVRILESYNEKSVAQIIGSGRLLPKLEVGDQVTSRLDAPGKAEEKSKK